MRSAGHLGVSQDATDLCGASAAEADVISDTRTLEDKDRNTPVRHTSYLIDTFTRVSF